MPTSPILNVIINAIDDVNQSLPLDGKLGTSLDSPLYGPKGGADSLTLTILIVAIEQRIEEELHCSISLTDYALDLDQNNPFRSVAALLEHITNLIGQKNHAG